MYLVEFDSGECAFVEPWSVFWSLQGDRAVVWTYERMLEQSVEIWKLMEEEDV